MLRLVVLLCTAAVALAYELNSENWDELTEGKTVFVKYFTTWCKHCEDIAPDWEKLEDKYRDSDSVIVGHVQCNGEAHTLCERDGVNSYPEIKQGAYQTLYSYIGNHTFEAWDAVVSELKKPCNVLTFEHCSEKAIADIKRIVAMDEEETLEFLKGFSNELQMIDLKRAKVVRKATWMYERAQEQYDRDFDALQKLYPYEIMNAVAQKKKELKLQLKDAVEVELKKMTKKSDL